MADNSISYLNKTFGDFKASLINYAKTYFPTTYNDFSDASPGGMFIEMASYVGDVMSFYLDTQVQENFLLYAKEKENLYALSYMLGYRPKTSYASITTVDIFQLIPATNIVGVSSINYTYATIIPENTVLTADGFGTKFLTVEKVDFNDPANTEVTLYSNQNYFLLKKQVKVISAEIKSTTINFSTPQKFSISNISDTNILQILDATDSQGNSWYEVPYLAQATIFDKIANPSFGTDGVPYLLQLKRVPRRYVSRFLSDGTLQLEFGAGISTNKTDQVILPTPDNIQLGLVPGISSLYNNFNKTSVFYTQEYGLAPSSNIVVRYLVGGGLTANTNANTINTIDQTQVAFPNVVAPLSDPIAIYIRTTVAVTNPTPAVGGRNGDQVEEIRNNALNAYQSQLRAVTREDYMVRALSLPSLYGSIAKVYVTQDVAREELQTSTVATIEERNPLSLDMYILSYDSSKKLNTASTTLKNNLITYIDQFRMVTDAINIKDAFYINIGINFDITVKSGFNNNTVIMNCISALQDHFNIEKWNVNQPIVISDVQSQLLQVSGVQSIIKLEFTNKFDSTGTTYSQYGYDIAGATRNRNIYPSLDPSIFELRYPNTDIQGRVVFV
jgi:hypothetical protein